MKVFSKCHIQTGSVVRIYCQSSETAVNNVLTFNGNKWTNISPTLPVKVKFAKYKFMNLANAYSEGLYIPLGYAGYIIRCYNELPGQNYYIRLPATNSVTDGTMFYVQIKQAMVNVSFYPCEIDQQGPGFIILLGGVPWANTTVSSELAYKFTFHANLPNAFSAGYILEVLFNNNKMP